MIIWVNKVSDILFFSDMNACRKFFQLISFYLPYWFARSKYSLDSTF